MRKRIALLAPFPQHLLPGFEKFPPRGHYATWLPQLCQAFAAQTEFEITWLFITREVRDPMPFEWLNQQFSPLYVPGRLRLLHGYLAESRAIRDRLRIISPTLVHAWGSENCYGLAGARAGFPWLLSMQGLLGEYVRRVPMHPFVRLQALYERSILRRATEITVESRWGLEVLRRMAPHARLHQVEYGVAEAFFTPTWTPDPARPVALFIGTPELRKGLQDAIEAFRDSRLAGAELHVLGHLDGKLAQKLRLVSPPNVRWIGHLDREETAEKLSRAWCLVLPTRTDTSPNAVKEARVLGLPVVTTPEGGQSDYIVDGENGFLVPPGDVAGLAQALSTLLTDLARTKAMGANRWAEQREYFRPEQTAVKFLELYRHLTAGRDEPVDAPPPIDWGQYRGE